MRPYLILAPLVMLGCADEGTFDVVNGLPTDDVGDTDVTSDDGGTDNGGKDDAETDTDVEDTGDAPNPDSVAWHHAISELGLLPPGQGFDLDGSGDIDNALGGLARFVGDLLDGLVQGSETVGIFQTWGVEDGDNQASVGILTGADTDGDTEDNFDGDELFIVSDGLRPDGRSLIAARTRVGSDGSFEARIPAGEFTLLGFTLPTASDIFIEGTVTESKMSGRIGTAVPLEVLLDLVSQTGIDFLSGLVEDAADVDTDGDNNPDAVSLALSFSGVSCLIEDGPAPTPQP